MTGAATGGMWVELAGQLGEVHRAQGMLGALHVRTRRRESVAERILEELQSASRAWEPPETPDGEWAAVFDRVELVVEVQAALGELIVLLRDREEIGDSAREVFEELAYEPEPASEPALEPAPPAREPRRASLTRFLKKRGKPARAPAAAAGGRVSEIEVVYARLQNLTRVRTPVWVFL